MPARARAGATARRAAEFLGATRGADCRIAAARRGFLASAGHAARWRFQAPAMSRATGRGLSAAATQSLLLPRRAAAAGRPFHATYNALPRPAFNTPKPCDMKRCCALALSFVRRYGPFQRAATSAATASRVIITIASFYADRHGVTIFAPVTASKHASHAYITICVTAGFLDFSPPRQSLAAFQQVYKIDYMRAFLRPRR